MADIQKKVLHAPNLPAAIQGDGRYLLSLLRSILTEQAVQINAANSFTSDDVNADKEGKVLSPRNFRLTFSRLGGLLQWDHSLDAKDLNYYEVRTNKNVGSEFGLLERTTLAQSDRLPPTYVGHIFLFAIDKQGQVSHPSELSYTKARPTKPRDVALTKTQEHIVKKHTKRLPYTNTGKAFICAVFTLENERYSILCHPCLLRRPFGVRCAR